MGGIAVIIGELEYGRSTLLEAINGLSERELTELHVFGNWTVRDILAHIIGWDYRTIQNLPLIVADRANEIPAIEVDSFNQESLAKWGGKSIPELLSQIESTHRQILDIIAGLAHVEIDKRHHRNGRVITIRSYVIYTMMEHDRQHAAEIEQWREQLLAKQIDPQNIKTLLKCNRNIFMVMLDNLSDEGVTEKGAVGEWSISDMVGHIADWEQLMLQSARHILDSSQPAIVPAYTDTESWNMAMAAERMAASWPENYHYLRRLQAEVDDLIDGLAGEDWAKRGPYPWVDDQGTLAELLTHIVEHYTDHTPDLERWVKERHETNA